MCSKFGPLMDKFIKAFEFVHIIRIFLSFSINFCLENLISQVDVIIGITNTTLNNCIMFENLLSLCCMPPQSFQPSNKVFAKHAYDRSSTRS
jgi:hypothetical protein